MKLHLDTFHMNIEEKNQAAAIRKVGKHLGHFHACGTDRGTPGADSLDWAPIVRALHDIGFDGDVVIESFTQDVKVIAAAAASGARLNPDKTTLRSRAWPTCSASSAPLHRLPQLRIQTFQ